MRLPLAYLRIAIVLVIGVSTLLVGLALMLLPGPGILVLLLGLTILSTEFVIAKRLLDKLKLIKRQLGRSATRILRKN